MQSALEKAMALGNIPGLVSSSFANIRTDMQLQDAMRHASSAIGINTSNISMTTLPGEDRYQGGLSYFFHDVEKTREVLLEIYDAKVENAEKVEVNDN